MAPRRPALPALRLFLRRLFLCALFSGTIHQLCHADQPPVEEILKRVAETYQNLQSYQLVAQRVMVANSASSTGRYGGSTQQFDLRKLNVTSDIMLAVGDLGKFRLEVKEDAGSVVSVSDGQKKWTYMRKRNEYTEEAVSSPPSNQAESGKAQPDLLESYRHLLIDRFRGLSRYSSTAVLQQDEQLQVGGDRIMCYVIKIVTPQGENKFWVDKVRYIVWRSVNVGQDVADNFTVQETTTFNLTEVKANVQPPDSLFLFTPPAKAVKVSTLK